MIATRRPIRYGERIATREFEGRADIASVWRVRRAVAIAVTRALDNAGMSIPFPQRTLWFPAARR